MDVLPPARGQEVWDETDVEKAFNLHSRPSASRKIFLEFKGCVTEVGWTKRCEQLQLDGTRQDHQHQPQEHVHPAVDLTSQYYMACVLLVKSMT
jgi:hypothetical protein